MGDYLKRELDRVDELGNEGTRQSREELKRIYNFSRFCSASYMAGKILDEKEECLRERSAFGISEIEVNLGLIKGYWPSLFLKKEDKENAIDDLIEFYKQTNYVCAKLLLERARRESEDAFVCSKARKALGISWFKALVS